MIKVGNTELPTNADSVKIIKGGKTILADAVKVIKSGSTKTVWEKQKYYYITYSANGGSGSMEKQAVPVGGSGTVAACSFTKSEYSFAFWTDASGNQYKAGDSITLSADITLYAQWKAVPFTVPLDSLTWTFTNLYNNGEFGHSQTASKVQVSIQANSAAQAVGRASANITTKGCNLCRVKYATYFATGGTGLAGINDQTLNNTNGAVQEVYLSVSGATWNLTFDIKDSDTYGENYMYITEILMTHS